MSKSSYDRLEPTNFSTLVDSYDSATSAADAYQKVPVNISQTTQQQNNDELFHTEEQKESIFSTANSSSMNWLRANFLLADQRCLFGTWDGVFTTIVINVFGILIFMRAGWMVANAGILGSCAVILVSYFIAIVSVSSGIGN